MLNINSHMDRRRFIRKSAVAAAGMAVSGLVNEQSLAGKTEKPNIIFILIDDLGWKDTGFMGSTYYETPNIDRLSRQGMVFTDAYANAPNCAPSRACLVTGQYSPRHGIYTVNSSERGQPYMRKLIPICNRTILDTEAVTIAEVLKSAGYVSASIGKWHLGEDPDHGPEAQGFDVNIGGNRKGHPSSYFSPYYNKNLKDGPQGEYLTDRLTGEALDFIETNRSRPFFLFLPHYSVHTPIQARENIIEKYRKKKVHSGQNNPVYAAMIESTDQGIGNIMDKLDELGLADNTVVFFFSDNGGHGDITSMKPLRGSKGMFYEGGIRVPLIVRWPDFVEPGSVCDTPVIGIDFFPTILEITGVSNPSAHILDGESLVSLLTQDGTLKRNSLFWHFPAYLEGYKNSPGPWRTTPVGAVRTGIWKLIEFFEDGHLELYNLKNDIGEKNNLTKTMPEKTQELHRELVRWRKSINAPVPSEINPLFNPDTPVNK